MILSDKTIKKLCDHDVLGNGTKDIGVVFERELDYRSYPYGDLVSTKRTIDVDAPMITPFIDHSVKELNGKKAMSFGLSSYGYDVRLNDEFKIFTNTKGTTIDPRNIDEDNYVVIRAKLDEDGLPYVILPPNSYLLGSTVETFNIPRDVLAICTGKSTYARAGAIVNVTPIEPGFKGEVVIEIANGTSSPMKIYAGMGIAQFMFFLGNESCEVNYADRDGKYQNQTGVTDARV